MSISTLQTVNPYQPAKPRKNNKIPIIAAAVVIALIGVFFGKNILNFIKNFGGKSGLAADIFTGRAELYINDEYIGITPYETKDLVPGQNKITLRSSNRQYETTVNFLSNSDKYIHNVSILRDLGVSDLFSSGQDLWFEEDTTDTVLRIISEPSGASVYIDSAEIGKTPFTSSKLTEGDYDLRVEKTGYESQKTRIRIQNGYTSNISVKLFPMPVPSRVSMFEGSDNLYDSSTDNKEISADPGTWVKGVVYWNQTRGTNLEGIGLNKELVFNYYIDYDGNIYDSLGNPAVEPDEIEKLKDSEKGAYLGRVSDGAGISDAAKETLKTLKGTLIVASDNMVEILPTGLGWLRVRSEPNSSSAEVSKVDVGLKFAVLEEQPGWVKIQVSETLEGWVSSTYTKKIEPEKKSTIIDAN